MIVVPSEPLLASKGDFAQPAALTPEVMVFFVTLCFLTLFRGSK